MARDLPSKINLGKSYGGLEGYAAGGQAMPSKGAAIAAGGDDHIVPVKDAKGKTKGVAGLKTGEVVFTVESIVGAGNGDYDKGLKYLLAFHKKLTEHGKDIIKKQKAQQGSLAQSPGPTS